MTEAAFDTAVAVTGMAGRFPGAPDLTSFWHNQCAGIDAIQHFDLAELRRSGHSDDVLDHPSFVPACAPMPDPYAFDEAHFGVSPATARALDPQHRVFLECAWSALEASGALAARHAAVAVFAGCSDTTYRALFDERDADQGSVLAADLGSSSDYLATRVAYLLDLRGPAVTVRTACSTSLVAIHFAVQSLLSNECDVAVAGGAAIRHPPLRGHIYEPGGIYSADGRCRPYDHLGSGIVSGDGAGAVVLRRLADAIKDGDHVHAVIRGSAINNDGAAKAGFTAPSVAGQVEVAQTALEMAAVSPATIGFIEGHGTATPLGDPIEIEALSRVWEHHPGRRVPCVLGSVKSGIGHLDAAAGVASFIKACLAVEHGRIPGTLNYTAPNPHSGLADSAFLVSAETRDWHETGPRRASVHSLGLGGTNAHVVLEQGPARHEATPSPVPVVFPLSTRRQAALRPYAKAVADDLAATDPDVAAAARTLQHGRTAEQYRRVVVGSSREQLIESLRALAPPARCAAESPRLVLAFPGDGKRVRDALRELAEHVPSVATVLREAAAHLDSRWGVDLFAVTSTVESSAVGVLPAIVAQGIALHAALDTFGAGGDMVLGQSLGELSAAAASGLISMPDALELAMARELAFRAVIPSGALAVGMAPDALVPRLPRDIELSLVNSPYRCVVSGPADALGQFAGELAAEDIPVHQLDVISAVHCSLLDPVLDEFRHAAARLTPRRPARALLSTVGPTRVDDKRAADPDHWVRQLREPIRFDACLRSAASGERDVVIVDVGPSGGLAAAIAETVGSDARAVIPVSPQAKDVSELDALGRALGQLWEEGVPIDWDAWPRRAAHRTVLPVPPLARTVHKSTMDKSTMPDPSPTRAEPPAVALWSRGWRPVHLSGTPGQPQRIAVLSGPDPLGAALAKEFTQRGHELEVIEPDAVAVAAAERDLIIDARALGAPDGPAAAAAFLTLAATMARADHRSAQLLTLTRGAFDIVGTETLSPAAAAVAAAALVAAQEYEDLRVTCLDLGDDATGADVVARALLAQSAAGVSCGLRGRRIWVPVVEEVDLPAPPGPPLPAEGAWVITGGCGRFGRWVGRWLAKHGCRDVFLIGRTGAASAAAADAVSAMRSAGTRVTVVEADLADRPTIFRTLDDAYRVGAGTVTVFHLAGAPNAVSAGAPVDDLTRDGLRAALDEQWSAKVSGADTLHDWVRRHPATRCVTFSSNAALLGGPGLAAYAAANAALDLLAVQARDRDGLNWCSVGWDGWRVPDDPPDLVPSALEEYALRGVEPWAAVQDAMAAARSHVAVAKGDLRARHREWVERLGRHGRPKRAGTSPNTEPVPAGSVGVLHTVRRIWADVFGREIPDDGDLFIEGGDSLVAMRIRGRIERELNAELTLQEILKNRTIAGHAALVRERADATSSAPPNETIRGRV